MKKFLTFILMLSIALPTAYNFCNAKVDKIISLNKENEQNNKNFNINETTTNKKVENIKETLKNLKLSSLKGEESRDNIYNLLKNNKEIFKIFEPATKDADKLSDILSEYDLRNYTNDFYIVLNNILKEKPSNNTDINKNQSEKES